MAFSLTVRGSTPLTSASRSLPVTGSILRRGSVEMPRLGCPPPARVRRSRWGSGGYVARGLLPLPDWEDAAVPGGEGGCLAGRPAVAVRRPPVRLHPRRDPGPDGAPRRLRAGLRAGRWRDAAALVSPSGRVQRMEQRRVEQAGAEQGGETERGTPDDDAMYRTNMAIVVARTVNRQ